MSKRKYNYVVAIGRIENAIDAAAVKKVLRKLVRDAVRAAWYCPHDDIIIDAEERIAKELIP